MGQTAPLLLKVDIREESGLFFASSPHLLGLHLCGPSKEQICDSLLRAVQLLFKQNRQMDVTVSIVNTDLETFPRMPENCEHLLVQQTSAERRAS